MLQADTPGTPTTLVDLADPAPCLPALLAALGPLLRVAEPLHPLRRAWPVLDPVCVIDRDGPREGLQLGRPGRDSRPESLFLLPDSDYLAWERLLEGLRPDGCDCGSHEARAWPRWPGRPRLAMPVRVDADGLLRPLPLLALSAVGVSVARRIAHAERARLLGAA